jgi:metal-responsive CopG/Arc/MetJ family transcriptional regulator
MADETVSVRLDDEAAKALKLLTRGGVSRSRAIRDALVDAARRRRGESLATEAARLAQDPDDRAEMLEVAELMEDLRASR